MMLRNKLILLTFLMLVGCSAEPPQGVNKVKVIHSSSDEIQKMNAQSELFKKKSEGMSEVCEERIKSEGFKKMLKAKGQKFVPLYRGSRVYGKYNKNLFEARKNGKVFYCMYYYENE